MKTVSFYFNAYTADYFVWKQEEAAQAYDRACIEARGQKAITNFPLSDYSEFIEQLRKSGAYKESSSDTSEHNSKA